MVKTENGGHAQESPFLMGGGRWRAKGADEVWLIARRGKRRAKKRETGLKIKGTGQRRFLAKGGGGEGQVGTSGYGSILEGRKSVRHARSTWEKYR